MLNYKKFNQPYPFCNIVFKSNPTRLLRNFIYTVLQLTFHYCFFLNKFRVAVRITNKGHKDYTVKVILRVDAVDYTGKNGSLVAKVEQQKVVLHDPGKRPRQCATIYEMLLLLSADESMQSM